MNRTPPVRRASSMKSMPRWNDSTGRRRSSVSATTGGRFLSSGWTSFPGHGPAIRSASRSLRVDLLQPELGIQLIAKRLHQTDVLDQNLDHSDHAEFEIAVHYHCSWAEVSPFPEPAQPSDYNTNIGG